MGSPSMSVKAHALFAASASKRWTSCPSSLKRIETAPPQEENKAGITGTLCHELMEVCLENGLTDAKKGLKFVEDKSVFTKDMIERVQGFIEYVWAELAKYPSAKLLVEKRVYLDKLHITEAFGTVDVAIVEPFGTLHIIDYKDGFEWVGHIDNTQMIYYALGICYEEGFDFGEVKTTIYQPKTGKAGEVYEPRTDTFNVNKLYRFEKFFIDAIEVCESATEDSHLNAGSHCRWCPAKVSCPALTRSSFEMAKLDFSEVVQPSPKSLTSDQIKTLLDRAAYIKLWIKEVEKYAEENIRAGKKISGWGLVPTRGQRVWKDAKLVADKYPELFRKELMTPAQAEAVLKKAIHKDRLIKFMNDNVVTVSSGEKLQTTNNYDVEGLDDLDID